MRLRPAAFVLVGAFLAASGSAIAGDQEKAPVYTREDLERMFGPAEAAPSDPVDKSGPEDWAWIEQFLDRQYARIDADRRYDLDRGVLDVATSRSRPVSPYYGGSVAWGLGYPASTWWSAVHAHYSHALAPAPAPHDHGGGRGENHSGHRR